MEIKLFDSELKVMEVLWNKGEMPAGEIARILKEEIGWNRNTTYTIIKKCIDKGAILRKEPNYICMPLIAKELVQQQEATEFLDKMFGGSIENFFAAFIGGKKLSPDQVEKLKKLVEEMK